MVYSVCRAVWLLCSSLCLPPWTSYLGTCNMQKFRTKYQHPKTLHWNKLNALKYPLKVALNSSLKRVEPQPFLSPLLFFFLHLERFELSYNPSYFLILSQLADLLDVSLCSDKATRAIAISRAFRLLAQCCSIRLSIFCRKPQVSSWFPKADGIVTSLVQSILPSCYSRMIPTRFPRGHVVLQDSLEIFLFFYEALPFCPPPWGGGVKWQSFVRKLASI